MSDKNKPGGLQAASSKQMRDDGGPELQTGTENADAIAQVATKDLPKANEEQLKAQKEMLSDLGEINKFEGPDILNPGFNYEHSTFEQIMEKVGEEDAATLRRFAAHKGMDEETMRAWVERSYQRRMIQHTFAEETALEKFKRIFIGNLRNTRVSI